VSVSQKRWKQKPKAEKALSKKLAESLGVNPAIGSLLVQRGIQTFDEAKTFFRPSFSHLHDPFLMKDMDKAIARIEYAIGNKEPILIFGDYDVDGTTAVSLVYSFLKNFSSKIEYYIPDRYKEGYGISTQGIDFAHENGFKLIIALDCGIKSIDKIDYAKQKGIDFIICDHHRPGDELPAAVAVLDPKRADCTYPFDELSGCGIGFKLIQAFAISNELFSPDDIHDKMMEYLDLVAVSIAADLVPITGENRILAYFGLQQLNTKKREGFKAIIELSKVKKELTISDIVFSIAPRINAAGRLDSGNKAVELLVSATTELATDSGKGIDETNTERKSIDLLITQQAFAMIDEDEELQVSKSTVLFQQHWHKGVVGIVASRLTEKYYRPTIILTESNGMATGSARSVKDFDVYNAIESCAELLEQFGGHKYAAGLTLKVENVPAFQKKFEQVVSDTIKEEMLTPEIEIDSAIQLNELDAKFYRIVKQFAPFGPNNMNPVFITTKVKHKLTLRKVGVNHLKMDIYQEGLEKSFPAIAFGMGHYYDELMENDNFDICFAADENEWNGNIILQLNIKDIKIIQ
jgi:single-stranded-DNA-specific exonuclease